MSTLKKKPSISVRAANFSYIQAYVYHEVNFNELLGERVTTTLLKESQQLNSNINIVAPLFLSGLSFSAGHKITVKAGDFEKSKLGLYWITVAKPGAGKTPAFQNVLRSPLRKIEKTKNDRLFFMESFTPAGFLSNLAINKGHLIIAADEIGHVMEPHLAAGKKPDDSQELRSQLNHVFSGSGTSKAFSTKPNLVIPESHVIVCGTTHPRQHLDFLYTLKSAQDGLSDRFLTICSPGDPEDKDEALNMLDDRLPEEWADKIYTLLFETEDFVSLDLSDGAKSFLKDVKSQTAAVSNEKFRKLSARMRRHKNEGGNDKLDVQPEEVPGKIYDSKNCLIALRLAAVCEIASGLITALLDGTFQGNSIPTTVSEQRLRAAFNAVDMMKKQEEDLMGAFQSNIADDLTSVNEIEAIQNIAARATPRSPQKEVLLCPGMAVTSSIVQKRARPSGCLSASEILNAMEDLQQSGAGKYRKIDTNKHVFYKYPWEKTTDKQYIENKGVNQASYETAYNADMSTSPSNAAVTQRSWPAYWQKIVQHTPDECKPNA